MRFESAIEELKKDLLEKASEIKNDPRLAQLLKTLKTLNGLEELDGKSATSLSEVLDLDVESQSESKATAVQPQVRFDEFVGLRNIDAAKLYLKKFKDARPFNEIVEAINTGSSKTLSLDEETKLKNSLTRSTLHVIKIGDRYGLLENYPHVKRGKKHKEKTNQGNESNGTEESSNETASKAENDGSDGEEESAKGE